MGVQQIDGVYSEEFAEDAGGLPQSRQAAFEWDIDPAETGLLEVAVPCAGLTGEGDFVPALPHRAADIQ